jgi:DNA polymerase (family 10)
LRAAGAGGKTRAAPREKDIYKALDLPFIPPEIREGAAVIERARQGELPDLLEEKDLKGDLHLHSRWSDGIHPIEVMAARAAARGYDYIAITDHSPSLKIANGLSPERLQEQMALIRQINESGKYPCHIFSGMEVDIKADGTLDLPDELLAALDLVIASVHSDFRQSKKEMTRRICRALAHPAVHILGHPTGRLLGSRGGYQVDLEEVINQAAATGTAIEINSSPQRLDLAANWLPRAKEKGVLLAVNTDAHSLVTMEDLVFGVTVARRGGLEARDVMNTHSLKNIKTILKGIRKNPCKHG